MDTKGGAAGGGGGGVMNWVIGIDMYTLMCIKWITNKNLLYKKINKIQNFKNKKGRKPNFAVLLVLFAQRGTFPNTGIKIYNHPMITPLLNYYQPKGN